MVLYILRVIADPTAYIKEDFSSPAKIATVGAFSMATCLLGKAIRINELDFPSVLPATIVYAGSIIQVLSILRLFLQRYAHLPLLLLQLQGRML